jgi:P4 family phage/plasmid primase-like protien
MSIIANPPNKAQTPISSLKNDDVLRWAAERKGIQFCLVTGWDDKGASPGKRAIGENWQNTPYSLNKAVKHLQNGGNVGMLCGPYSAFLYLLDLDTRFSAFCERYPQYTQAPTFVRVHAENPDVLAADKGKLIVYVRASLSGKKFKFPDHPADNRSPDFEVLGERNQGVIAGRHVDGSDYALINPDGEIPCLEVDELNQLCLDWTGTPYLSPEPEVVEIPRVRVPARTYTNDDGLLERVKSAWTPASVFHYFGRDKNGTRGENGWTRLFGNGGLFVHNDKQGWYTFADSMGGGVFEAWTYCETGGVNVPKGKGFYNLLKRMADAAGIDSSLAITPTNGRERGLSSNEEMPTTSPTSGAYKLDDIGNGERLIARHGDKMRYVKEWGWMVWGGGKWGDDRGQAAAWAKETARSIYSEAAASEDDNTAAALAKHAKSSANKGKREAMLDSATSEPGVQATPDDFDRNPWLLNLQNGCLDLKTNEFARHSPEPLITKMAGTRYEPTATCPIWERFLSRVFDADAELIEFVQRAVGYSLTGKIGEQCFFFLYGLGANGKSTFTGAIQDLLGDYGMKIRAETLMIKRSDIPEEVAQIAGRRFLLAAELGDGERLNESLIKDLTGGDRLRARLLYHQSFEFIPQAKSWLYGNHKPIVRGTDEGIWRRVRLIPFNVTIPEHERDGGLPEKLRAELPGILNWALVGCQKWQQEGLDAPEKVRRATANYRAEQDILATFLDDCCTVNSLATVTAGELYQAYRAWADENGLNALSKISFSRQLGERGYSTRGRDGAGRAVISGLGLKTKE